MPAPDNALTVPVIDTGTCTHSLKKRKEKKVKKAKTKAKNPSLSWLLLTKFTQ